MLSLVVPKGLIACLLLKRSKLVVFSSFYMNLLSGYVQPWQVPKVYSSHRYVVSSSWLSRRIGCDSGRTHRNVFLAMFPPLVAKYTPRALTLYFTFINCFLVNSLVCSLSYSVYDLASWHCCSLLELRCLLFCCLEYPFRFVVKFRFLTTAVVCSGAFPFWATLPKEFPLSFCCT